MTDFGQLDPDVRALLEAEDDGARFADGDAALDELRSGYARTAEALGGTPAPVARVEDADAGGVGVRVYVPAEGECGGSVLYAHGGGWVIGDLDGIDRVCRRLAASSGLLVCSVDYRLAPEHPFPAPIDDVCTALAWLRSEEAARRFGHDPSRTAVAGDSAGGNLVAVAALRHASVIEAQLLFYPALDATLTSPSYDAGLDGYGLSRDDMATAYRSYLAGADEQDPSVSPLLAGDVSPVAPARIVVASHDVLRDDGVRYAARLREAGVEVELEVLQGLVHGFIRWGGAVSAANQAIDSGAEFLRRRLN